MSDYMTAVHEAGHAWAYYRHRKPLRYATIRPASQNLVGICRPWRQRRIDLGASMWIASAGPIAQAMHAERTSEDWEEWDDLLLATVLTGGDDDYAQSLGALDSPEYVALLRGELERDWAAVETVAAELMATGTVHGRRLAEVFRS